MCQPPSHVARMPTLTLDDDELRVLCIRWLDAVQRGEFHGQAVAPSIFAIGDLSDLVPPLEVSLTVKNAPRRLNFPFTDPDDHPRICPEVLDPSGGFTRFGEEIKTVAAYHEPNLDLPWQ